MNTQHGGSTWRERAEVVETERGTRARARWRWREGGGTWTWDVKTPAEQCYLMPKRPLRCGPMDPRTPNPPSPAPAQSVCVPCSRHAQALSARHARSLTDVGVAVTATQRAEGGASARTTGSSQERRGMCMPHDAAPRRKGAVGHPLTTRRACAARVQVRAVQQQVQDM